MSDSNTPFTPNDQPPQEEQPQQPYDGNPQQYGYGQPQPPYNNPQQYGYGQQQPPYQQPYNPQHQQNQSQQPPYGQPQQPFNAQPPQPNPNNQPPYPPYYARPLTDNTKLFSILSYVGILWIVGLAADSHNPKVRYHVNQGIILFIFELVLSFVCGIMRTIIHAIFMDVFSGVWITSSLGAGLSGILSLVAWFLVLAFIIIGIVHAAQDREEPLPVIGTLFTVIR